MSERAETAKSEAALNDAQKCDTLESIQADLAELERKLIPLLNKIRRSQGKPAIIVPKTQDYWR